MKVEIRGVGPFQKIFGKRQISMEIPERATLKTVIRELDSRSDGKIGGLLFNENGTQNDSVRIFLNGRDVRFLGQSEPPLTDGDIILFLPVLAGG